MLPESLRFRFWMASETVPWLIFSRDFTSWRIWIMDFSDIFRTFTSNFTGRGLVKEGLWFWITRTLGRTWRTLCMISMSYSEFLLWTYLSAVSKSAWEKGNLCSNFLSRFRAIAKYVKILYNVLPCDSIQRFNWTLTMDQRIICSHIVWCVVGKICGHRCFDPKAHVTPV